ncbi:DUF4198 domain-containing protein [Alkalihalobacterium bogoriense]|uniref:DUF4198 domain-containing protein n=1 Tax=Alkalihalobacterium bogoriense TaxID=246272 RepID=UPI00047B501B|nr:DUF4198 domain-containing protein [Alkalihalobacterium bogoriense]
MFHLFFSRRYFFSFIPKGLAHELFIQIQEDQSSGELQIDVLWGHIRDFVDEGNYENYKLQVRYPDGSVESLPLEKIGVQARAYFQPTKEGEYVFWAERKPSTYTPDGGDTQLSLQMAKTIFYKGDGDETSQQPTNLALEVVPTNSLSNFTTGFFEGQVLLDGEAVSHAIISGYGPKGEVLEGESDENGLFELNLSSSGEWLIKANVRTDEEGVLDGEEYIKTSRTSTFLLDTGNTEQQRGSFDASLWSLILTALIALFVGATVTLLVTGRKKQK